MDYKYVTEDNLENKQTYMYSEYGAWEFVDAYIKSRRDKIEQEAIFENEEERMNHSLLYVRLEKLKKQIQQDIWEQDMKNTLNKLIQSFEVRKRLYSDCDDNWRPVNTESSFREYDCYIIFAQILEISYRKTGNLKYFSCLLKLNDTIISIWDQLNRNQIVLAKEILKTELFYFYEEFYTLKKEGKK